MTPYARYLELMDRLRGIHVGKRDERAPVCEELERLLDILIESVDAFFGDDCQDPQTPR